MIFMSALQAWIRTTLPGTLDLNCPATDNEAIDGRRDAAQHCFTRFSAWPCYPFR